MDSCWDMLLFQQILDAIKRLAGDNFVSEQDSPLVHLSFMQHSPTAAVQNSQLPFR